MAVLPKYETFAGRPLFAFRVVDRFAAELGTLGDFPPIIGALRFFLAERADIGRKYDPPRELLFWQSAAGNFLTGGDMLGAKKGDPTLNLATGGNYKIQTRSDYYQTAEIDVNWPPANLVEKDLLPSPAYPFPDATSSPPGFGATLFRGALFQPDGVPKSGAAVSVEVATNDFEIPADWLLSQTKTGETGEWALALPDERRLRIHGPPERKPQFGADLKVDGAVIHSLMVNAGRENVFSQASLRGTAADRFGRPLAGVKVTNSLQAGTSITDPNGRYSIFFPITQPDAACTVKATSPAGTVISNNAMAAKARQTVIVPRFQFP